jgi:opacity protein-like surface antigen
MNVNHKILSFALLAVMAATVFSPAALADSRQKNKNTWRNLGIAGAAVAGYGLLHHNTTATVLGAAGAGYSAYRYEKERKSQDAAKRARERYRRYHRYHRSYHRSYRRVHH